MNRELQEIIKSFKASLDIEQSWGVREYFETNAPLPRREGPINRLQQLDELKKEAMECRGCGLFMTRRNLVFGEGDPNCQLMFIGEAPGMEEDLKGRPFVGRAGELLNKIIAAMGLKRSEVYIANCLKCRPPENRSPSGDEIISCMHFLEEQIRIIKPDVICGLGRFAAMSLLKMDKPIGSTRGRFHDYEGIKFMPTFHPAYLLRNPADKKLCWQDMKKIMAELGLPKK